MNYGESNNGFYLLFHTLFTDKVLFPISTDYIFHNKSSITCRVAHGRQDYWAASLPCLCLLLMTLSLIICWGSQSPLITTLEMCLHWLHRADQIYGWLICLKSQLQPLPSWPHLDPSWCLVQFSSVVQSCPTLWDLMNHSTPGSHVHHQLPESSQTHIHQADDAIQPSHPLLSPSLPPLNPPSIRVFSNESTPRVRWPKYWSFSFSISPTKEHTGLISFRMDWLDLPAVQGTLRSLLQHHS